MAKFARFENETPVYQPVAVADKSQAYEKSANVLNQASNLFLKQGAALYDEQSNIGTLQSILMGSEVKNTAQMEMMKNPGNAQDIVEHAKTNLESISNNAIVNKQDKLKLEYQFSSDIGSLGVKAIGLQMKQSKANAAISISSEYPAMLDDLLESYNDPKSFEFKADNINSMLNSAVQSGSITPKTYQHYVDMLNFSLSKAELKINSTQDEELTAEDHAGLTNNTFTSAGPTDHVGNPTSEHTASLVANWNADVTKRGMKSDLANKGEINLLGIDHLKNEADLIEMGQYMSGTKKVQNVIHSNGDMSRFQQRLDHLNSQSVLSYEEQGEKDRLESFLNGLDKGQSYQQLQGNAAIQNSFNDYSTKMSAIESSSLSTLKKQQAADYMHNQLQLNGLHIMKASGLSEERVNPIVEDVINVGQSALSRNQDVMPWVETLSSMDPELRPWAAKQLRKPLQVHATRMVGYGDANLSSDDKQDLMLASQTGQEYSFLNIKDENGGDSKKVATVKYDIATGDNSTLARRWLSQQPNATNEVSSFDKLGLNFVYQKAVRNNDANLDNSTGSFLRGHDSYYDQWENAVGKSYKIQEGSNYIVNMSSNDFTVPQIETLSKGLIGFAENAKRLGKTDQQYYNDIGLNPLHMINNSYGDFMIVDAHGSQVPLLIKGKFIDKIDKDDKILHFLAAHNAEQEKLKRKNEIDQKGVLVHQEEYGSQSPFDMINKDREGSK